MELGTHNVVVVASEDANAGAALPVPDADGLVVRGAQDPWILVVEECCADVIQVPQQSEDAAFLLVIPHLDLVVVAAGDEQGLLVVEADAAHWTIVLIKFVQQRAHPVVPELDDTIVQTKTIKSVMSCQMG